MGGKTSKILSYEEAAQRLDESEKAHLAECFKRMGRTPTSMDKSTFIRQVVAELVPDAYLEPFYAAWGGESQEISLKDAMVGFVVVTKNDILLRKKFVFAILDVFGEESVTRRSFETMLLNSEHPIPKPIMDYFRTNERMDFKTFTDFVDKNRTLMSLFEWIFAPPPLKASEVNAPTFHETIAKLTNFTDVEEVKTIERRFWDIQGYSAKCDAKNLCKALCPSLSPAVVSRLTYMFDENKDGVLDFQELMKGIALICRSPLESSLNFCFRFFDIDEDGSLDQREIEGLLSVVHPSQTISSQDPTSPARTRSFSASVERSNSTESGALARERSEEMKDLLGDKEEVEEDGLDIPVPPHNAQFSLSDSKSFHDALTAVQKQLSGTSGGVLSLDGFKQCGELVAQVTVFLRRVKEAFMLNLGVRPSSLAEEAEAIRNLRNAERAQKIHTTPGEAGYLLSYAWLSKWKLYVGYDTPSVFGVAPSPPPSRAATPANSPARHSEAGMSRSSSTSSSRHLRLNGAGASQGVTNVSYPHPGPINNDPLIHVPSALEKVFSHTHRWGPSVRSNLVRDKDYIYASEALWNALSLWYGGGPALPRPTMRVVEGGVERIEVELHPFNFKIMKHQAPKMNQGASETAATKLPPAYLYFTIECSRTQTIAELTKYVCQQQAKQAKGRANLKLDEMRLWDYRKPSKPVLLEDDVLTIEQARLEDGQAILLEVRNLDLSWPSELFLVAKAQEESADGDVDTGSAFAKNRPLGATGISNLGNTCFMNSSLQCLSHTPPLTEYFNQNSHHAEINLNNPLGTKGHMASHYGDLVKKLWSGKASVAPVKFRRAIQRFAPQFSGNQQHDSQELLAFLLDGLHEDLNRVTVKPYVERKDSDGRPDVIVAKESWENHLQRNKSIVVDMFHGLLKSQLRCLTCQFVSVAFDPFTFLTLPLPTQSSTFVEVRVVRLDGSTPVRYGVQVPADPTYALLKDALSKLCELEPRQLIFVDAGATIQKVTTDERQKIRALSGLALTAYEVVPQPSSTQPEEGELVPAPEGKGENGSSSNEQNGDSGTATASSGSQDSASTSSTQASGGVAGSDASVYTSQSTGTSVSANTSNAPTPAASAPVSRNASSNNLENLGKAGVSASSGNSTTPVTAPSSASSSSSLSSASTTNPAASSTFSASNPKTSYSDRVGSLPGRNSTAFTGAGASRTSFVSRSVEGHLVIAHRKLVKQELHFLVAPLRPVVFGSPILVPYRQNETTWEEVYQSVWKMVRRLVQADRRALIDKGELPFPFELKVVVQSGYACSECRWYNNCLGCARPRNMNKVDVPATSLIAMDWDLTTLHLHFNQSEVRAVTDHSSMEEWRRAAEKPITLEDCLSAFTKEEELGKDELWYCPKCKTHRQAAKKMDIWSLPPFLIIHLKRFQNINGAWVKSHRPVRFSLTDFDPYKYAAPAAQAAVERARARRRETETAAQATFETSVNESLVVEDELASPKNRDGRDGQGEDSHAGSDVSARKDTQPEASEKQPEAATEKPLTDEDLDISQVDPHSSLYLDANAPRKFDLYALSSHLGILGGGHYVAFAQDKENKWYVFNDSSCKEVPAEEVERESSHAYMLFYQCRDLDMSKFIPPKQEGVTFTPPKIDDDYGEEGDRKRDLCTIS